MSKTTKPGTQPVYKIRQGAVGASIWCNETERGPMFNVTFQRVYKNGDAWKNSTSFGRKDLLVIGLIAARAFEWIGGQPRNNTQPASSQKREEDVPF